MTPFKRFLTIASGLFHIVLFPVLISLIVSLISYLTMPGMLGVMLSVFLCICGLIAGLILAFITWRRRGSEVFFKTSGENAEQEETTENEQNNLS